MKRYSIYIRWVEKEEDWKDESLISEDIYSVSAVTLEEAQDKGAEKFAKGNPGVSFYVRMVSELVTAV